MAERSNQVFQAIIDEHICNASDLVYEEISVKTTLSQFKKLKNHSGFWGWLKEDEPVLLLQGDVKWKGDFVTDKLHKLYSAIIVLGSLVVDGNIYDDSGANLCVTGNLSAKSIMKRDCHIIVFGSWVVYKEVCKSGLRDF